MAKPHCHKVDSVHSEPVDPCTQQYTQISVRVATKPTGSAASSTLSSSSTSGTQNAPPLGPLPACHLHFQLLSSPPPSRFCQQNQKFLKSNQWMNKVIEVLPRERLSYDRTVLLPYPFEGRCMHFMSSGLRLYGITSCDVQGKVALTPFRIALPKRQGKV